MIGNDIVDLALAKRESNWRRRGYLDKIFTPHEQQLIHSANDPDQLVWLLWSMKESAYKLAVRRTGNRIFAPSKIGCHLSEPASETVTGDVFYHEAYRTKSVMTPQYISTVAFAANAMPRYTQVIVPFGTTDYGTHQYQIREQIRQHVSGLFDTPEQEILISKDSIGVPLLTVGNSVSIPLSISHHGLYGAFAIGPSLLSKN
ncbi:4'-phosphopantetheinyl transferase family protein [Spirosoma fluviale]|uniref:4'-phosphopantetheinyl transferase superfamily protein n=1 Tax=Spirosoma fluviale TaxID=1597977 RepID=A0A286F7J5_9BACT|nr:4'-phosphopantetheinyl transferase superfamily protein [Spirosoma fluviale]SOD79197.1 4'-phosphopantetheinyl transferase superfamily protein [Spirosoma fluviale]